MNQADQMIAILGIGTAVPENRLDQADTSQRLAQALSEHPDSMRWAKRIFKQCGVETRYTCEPNLLESAEDCRYFLHKSNHTIPSTAERMETYKRESVPLALHAARNALLDGKVDVSDITHLITVSCTGQFLPGMDAELVQRLGLAVTVNRIPLNFLGCAAGLKAVCLSRQIVSSDPLANVLIVCVELCTLHIQPSIEREALFGASFFGDGASACIVGTAEPTHNEIFQLGDIHSVLLPDSAEEMVWEVGNYGFDLYLSPNIPKLIGKFIPEQVERLISGKQKPEIWAIHPGGKGIIDTLENMFGLTEEQTRPSRAVLKNYGNMSSATILFVLNEMRQELKKRGIGPVNGLSLAFGPGLTCEMIMITYLPSVISQEHLLDEVHV
ncbi:type III polyketide synthase [Paenibacillus alginolyticus]|uniref:Type III polyketide synthase n=1 Tax=Paenibacillus alginolyticus TaxID=59839 RepID=A0ABT4GGJ8_9BACL|nr:type III polyketide synthase [Paenibacillus alginolyticus]MCY9695323.1 type III polyketide synthase [Paenibacillus alginolyticus]MEC0144785.1 type III polyketide synthase [Paenibacillus alginolyticus]